MRLTAGKQAAKDTDSAAQEKEANGEQQQGLAGDGGTDSNNLSKDSSNDGAQLGKQGLHSGGSISN